MSQATARQFDLYPIKGYKPSPTSQIPGLFIAPLKEAIHKDVFKNLSANVRLLYLLLHDYVKWSEKQQVKSGNSYIKGKTIRVKAQRIKDEHFPHDTVASVRKWLRELEAVNLIARKAGSGNIPHFLITDYLSPSATREFEDNATKRDQAIAEIAAEKAVTKSDFRPGVISKDTSDVALEEPLLFNKETKETSSSPASGPEAVKGLDSSSSSSSATTEQENQLFELWSLKHNKKYIPRAAFLKHLRGFEKATFEWQDLKPEAAQRVLGAVIPTMPTEDENGRPIGSPMWLIKDDRNHKYLREGLKAEGIDIGHDLSEVNFGSNLVSQVTTKPPIKTKQKYFKPTLNAKNESPETERITFPSVKEMLEKKGK